MKEVGSIRELRERFCCEEPLEFGSEAEISALMSESESSTKASRIPGWEWQLPRELGVEWIFRILAAYCDVVSKPESSSPSRLRRHPASQAMESLSCRQESKIRSVKSTCRSYLRPEEDDTTEARISLNLRLFRITALYPIPDTSISEKCDWIDAG
ncbi:hypothetical protein DFH08DRAFT_850231 [Mycena albidolilacea]|uniref:Uncharacterized protein n=1 Tax=Mycena albidolilacea TaxID=1033008 RepID=A0AAD7AFD5_9AGAR|nr:hypothetical protein DFH08DRAFT_850231 [Mycena albidolilacea]